ncbi:hypothetical protein GCM10007860_16090 [Chitiniphilus shinanonensis]|uniref:Uncharacterized protein n=1 Tax=Chitiniphilus shinanonensis TaxID=553088 RepID=A0ABQ6BW89_9NEIS|nr:hypothetical protein [Chitiniphilus shinanonensis]GLS04462.1 hypothetical protein GCM10007860_16090 [Chitiniphilus shinanonensis]
MPVVRVHLHETRIRLAPDTDAQAAAALLAAQAEVTVHLRRDRHGLIVRYSLALHSHQELEALLQAHGHALADGPLARLARAIRRYAEQVARDNNVIPEHQLKARDVYARVWEHHPHGDHDDTPEELRRYL